MNSTKSASIDSPSSPGVFLPAFVGLPAKGGDPVCGMGRSWWYLAEQRGLIRLHRPRLRGNQRARALLPVREAVALIERLSRSAGPAKLEANEARERARQGKD